MASRKKHQEHDASGYTGESIQVLKGLEGVRKRPAMYIGGTDAYGLHHMVYEVVDNSIDEAMAGFCTAVSVVLHNDGSVTVEDNGRGIPVDVMPEEKKPALEVVLTTLHAGGKFDRKTYRSSGGLHGVGVSVVNALSEWMTAEVRRGGKIHRMQFARGKTKGRMKTSGAAKKTGTRISFLPDPGIFSETTLSFETLSERLREMSFLNAGVKVSILDERNGNSHEFQYKGGIVEFVRHLNRSKNPVHPKIIHVDAEKDDTRVEAAIQYNDSYQETVLSFVNSINTRDGGTHLAGFRQALTRAVNQYANQANLLRKTKENLRGDDLSEGLTAVLSIRIPEPQFEGQTKNKLGNSEVKGAVDSLVYEKILGFFEQNPPVARKIIGKAVEAAVAREAARKAKDLVRKQGNADLDGISGNLADCQDRGNPESEIFLVEGDSAGGSAKMARDRRFQAILPLKGKILNVEKARVDKMLGNQEIRNLVAAMGTGIGKDAYDADSLRYGRVIVMTDADVDGAHIRTLLLTFFFRNMRDLFDRGKIFIAQPPLYGVKNGKKTTYLRDERAFNGYLIAGGSSGVKIHGGNTFLHGVKTVSWLTEVASLSNLARRCEARGIPPFLLLRFGDALPETRKAMTKEPAARVFFERIARDWPNAGDGVDDISVSIGKPEEGSGVSCTLAWRTRKAKRTLLIDSPLLDSPDILEAEILLAGIHRVLAPPYRIEPGEAGGAETKNPLSVLAEIQRRGQAGCSVQRYKGLGEMNPEQLWETAMDPKSRTLVQVRVADSVGADQIFTTLMGEDSEARRAYIFQHASETGAIDI